MKHNDKSKNYSKRFKNTPIIDIESDAIIKGLSKVLPSLPAIKSDLHAVIKNSMAKSILRRENSIEIREVGRRLHVPTAHAKVSICLSLK